MRLNGISALHAVTALVTKGTTLPNNKAHSQLGISNDSFILESILSAAWTQEGVICVGLILDIFRESQS